MKGDLSVSKRLTAYINRKSGLLNDFGVSEIMKPKERLVKAAEAAQDYRQAVRLVDREYRKIIDAHLEKWSAIRA